MDFASVKLFYDTRIMLLVLHQADAFDLIEKHIIVKASSHSTTPAMDKNMVITSGIEFGS
jgi:hypothetical protein